MVNMSTQIEIGNLQYSPPHSGSPDELPTQWIDCKLEYSTANFENRLARNIIVVLELNF